MGCFTYWPANLDHPIWKSLSWHARGVFLELTGRIADGERIDLPEGMYLRLWLPHSTKERNQILKGIHELESAGILQRFDEPDGWVIVNWTSRVTVIRQTSAASSQMTWGQRSAAFFNSKRQKDAERKRTDSQTPLG